MTAEAKAASLIPGTRWGWQAGEWPVVLAKPPSPWGITGDRFEIDDL